MSNLIIELRLREREIAELKAEIERLNLLLALTLARSNLTRKQFIEVARLLKRAAPGG